MRRAFAALGGDCELFAVGGDAAVLAGAESWIRRMHDRFTRFSASSELMRFNARAGSWTPVSPELEAVLRFSLEAHRASGGLVHVGVLPALVAAGYGRDFAAGPTGIAGPQGAIAPLEGMLEVRPGEARVARGAALDLGGIAKGWLADRVCLRLGANALANLGGDLCARGGGPSGEGWPVGIGPRTVLLRDGGAATSGITKRAWGAGLHHLIDPRTGWPARTELHEVSVLAASAADAEVMAKAAFLLGREEGERWLEPRARGWAFS